MCRACMGHDSLVWRIHVWDMTQHTPLCTSHRFHVKKIRPTTFSCVEHDSFMRGHVWGKTHSRGDHLCHDSFICVTWLIHTCGVTQSCVGYDSVMCGAWLIHVWVVTHSLACHDSFMRWPPVTWLLRVYSMTHSCVYGMTHSCVRYGVASISRLLKIIGLFCKRAL